MKTIAILLLTASVASASLPFAIAASCLDGADEQFATTDAVLPEGTYLYANPASPEKVGPWTENNQVAGLQTSACTIGGIEFFPADAKVGGA